MFRNDFGKYTVLLRSLCFCVKRDMVNEFCKLKMNNSCIKIKIKLIQSKEFEDKI